MSSTKTTTSTAAILLTITCFAGLLFTSCNDDKKNVKSVVIEIPKDNSGLDTIDHFITDATIAAYKKEFQIQRDSLSRLIPSFSLPVAEAFNKRSILSLLQAPDCVGLRIYHGVKTGKTNELRVIIVGVNSKGNDILIDQGSVIAAKLTDNTGGLETGQCPSCKN